MRHVTNITIDQLVIHILDPQGQGLIRSSVDLPIQQDQTLIDYFTHHITASLREKSTRAARFRNINLNQPSGICQALIAGRTPLIDGSRQLAQLLYDIMAADRRISAGDLVVCFYRADNYPNQPFIAILKIDPSQIFRHDLKTDPQGNQYVTFEPDPRGFTRERLQKCAFVKSADLQSDYDMLLLDKQARGETGKIARFFSRLFLDADPAFDPREYSDRLYTCLTNAQSKVSAQLTDDERYDLDSRVRTAVWADHFSVDEWLSNLPYSPQVIDQIDEQIKTTIPDREFDLDIEYSKTLVERMKFRGSHGLKVEFEAGYYRNLIKSEKRIEDDPTRPAYWEVLIESEVWKKVTR